MRVSIHAASQLESLLNKNKRVDFIFEFSDLSPADNQLWSEKIKRNYFACGCNTGKLFTMYALLSALMVLLYLFFFQKDIFSFKYVLYSIVYIFLMAGIGKAAGKMIAYKNLKKDINELKLIMKSGQYKISS